MAAVSSVTPFPTAPWPVTSTTPPGPALGPPCAGEVAAPAADGKTALAPAPPTSAAADTSSRRRGTPGGCSPGMSEESLATRLRTLAAHRSQPFREPANNRAYLDKQFPGDEGVRKARVETNRQRSSSWQLSEGRMHE